MGAPARHQRSDSLGDQAEGEAALAAARARGQVRISAVFVPLDGQQGESRGSEVPGLGCSDSATDVQAVWPAVAGPSPACRPCSSFSQVLVTAGYTGEIKIYENMGLPQWL